MRLLDVILMTVVNTCVNLFIRYCNHLGKRMLA